MAPQILQGKNCTLMSFNVVEGIILLIVVAVGFVGCWFWFWGRIELDFVVISSEVGEIFLLELALLESENRYT